MPLCQGKHMKLSKTEKDFLKSYNIHDFDIPLASVDLCIFSIIDESLKVLLVKRSDYPLKDRWALPGGFVDIQTDKDLNATAIRKLKEKTGVKAPYVEQVETIGSNTRDPRGWSLTILYFALLTYNSKKFVATENVKWVSLKEAKKLNLAFDHLELLTKAIQRLRNKVSYTTLPIHILPKKFTLAELQKAYEIIMDRKVDKKSFRRRIEASNLLSETGELIQDGGRPAKLFRIRSGSDTHFYNRSI